MCCKISARTRRAIFGPLRTRVCDAIEVWLTQGIVAAMNQFNG
jgi:hypothetical protein